MYQALNFCFELTINRDIWLCLQSQASSFDVLLYPVRAQQEHMLRTERRDISNVEVLKRHKTSLTLDVG
jgi:hypothetical protein